MQPQKEHNRPNKTIKKKAVFRTIEIVGISLTIAGLLFNWIQLNQGFKNLQLSQENEASQKRYESYKSLSDSYQKILEFNTRNISLDSVSIGKPLWEQLTKNDSLNSPEFTARKILYYNMLTNHFEQAYRLIYTDKELQKELWGGWHIYICSYLNEKDFRDQWKRFGNTWSIEFQNYMNNSLDSMQIAN